MYDVKFDAQPNTADWTGGWQVLGEDGEPEDIYADGWAVTIRVARLPRGCRSACDYGFPDAAGCAGYSGYALSGDTDDGTLSVNDDDAIIWTFPASSMRGLCAGSYAVGLIATKDDQTVQLMLGTLPIIQGI